MGSDAWLVYFFILYTVCIYISIYIHIYTHIYIHIWLYMYTFTHISIYVCIVFCKWSKKASKTRLTWLTCTGFTVNEVFIITGTFSWWNNVICCLACEGQEQRKKNRGKKYEIVASQEAAMEVAKYPRKNVSEWLTFKIFNLYQAFQLCLCKWHPTWSWIPLSEE